MLGNPSHKELERHTICLHVINSSMKGWLGGGSRCRQWEGPDSAWWFSNQGRHLCEGNADIKKDKEEFTQQTRGLSGNVIGKR